MQQFKKKWTKSEILGILDSLKNGKSVEYLSGKSGRTPGAIRAKIGLCVYKMVNGTEKDVVEAHEIFNFDDKNKKTLDDLSVSCGVPKHLLKSFYETQKKYIKPNEPLAPLFSTGTSNKAKTEQKATTGDFYSQTLYCFLRNLKMLEDDKISKMFEGELTSEIKEELVKRIKALHNQSKTKAIMAKDQGKGQGQLQSDEAEPQSDKDDEGEDHVSDLEMDLKEVDKSEPIKEKEVMQQNESLPQKGRRLRKKSDSSTFGRFFSELDDNSKAKK